MRTKPPQKYRKLKTGNIIEGDEFRRKLTNLRYITVGQQTFGMPVEFYNKYDFRRPITPDQFQE